VRHKDPELTALSREIDAMSRELKALLPSVLEETGIRSEQSLHAIYGGKFADYIDIKNEVIQSPDHFVALYLEGFQNYANQSHGGSAHVTNFQRLKKSQRLQQYLFIFLKRTYLRNYTALSKLRPPVKDSAIWIGQNNADYGLLITPRFSQRDHQWQNDRSEIRHFEPLYWSIGHVLKTGLVIPGRNELISFGSAEEYLTFFVNVLVRNSGSKYEMILAEMYRKYVLSTPDPTRVPLLIPEVRYEGFAAKHRYRLDFTVIDPHSLTKVGFELSPWSTHGYLARTATLNQKQINDLARDNFEAEMAKHKEFFRRYGIFTLIYTDSDLADMSRIFTDVQQYLEPKSVSHQLRFHIVHDILGTNR
jgi:hypothetical protein